MTNRPRRSRPRKNPGSTIDLEAERIAPGGAPPEGIEAGELDADEASASAGPLSTEPGQPVPGDATAPTGDREAAPTDGNLKAALAAENHDLATAAVAAPDQAGEAAADAGRGDDGTPALRGSAGSAGGPEEEFAEEEGFTARTATADAGGSLEREPGSDAAEAELRPTDADADESAEARFAAEEGLDPNAAHPGYGTVHEDEEARPASGHPIGAAAALPYTAGSPSPEQGSVFGAAFAAGILGAIVAFAAVALMQYAGYWPVGQSTNNAAVAQNFAAKADTERLGNDLASLRNDVQQIKSAEAAGGRDSGVSRADLNGVANRVAALEKAAKAGPTGNAGVSPQAVDAANEAARRAQQTADQASQAVGNAAAAAKAAGDTAGQAADAARQGQQAAQQAQQVAQKAAQTAEANAKTVDDLQKRLAAVETGNKKAALAISAAALKAAIDRGGPFMSELESFASASGSTDATQSLRNFAAKGVPSGATLQREWPAVEDRILSALRPADPNAGVGQQVLSGLKSLVTVRPSGSRSGAGNGPEATVARLDDAMQRSDFQAFLKEWRSLPQPAQAASEDFATRLRARAQAEGVVDQALSNAVKATGNEG